MPFLPPNQQRQSTEGKVIEIEMAEYSDHKCHCVCAILLTASTKTEKLQQHMQVNDADDKVC